MTCRICGGRIAQVRLGRWPWVVTCSRTCADMNALFANQRASAAYKLRRREATRATQQP